MWPGRKLAGVQILFSVLVVNGGVHAKDLRTLADVLCAEVTYFMKQASVPISLIYRAENKKEELKWLKRN